MYEVTVTADLAYADADGQPLLADLYRPATEQAPPVVLYVHGGGFAVGSRSDGAEGRLAALAAHAVAVLSVDYRLVPAAHFPAQLHEVKAAVRWVRGCAPSLGVDGGQVGIWGASASALLAPLVGLTPGQASPLSWVSSGAPPFLIAHGDRDRVVPATESHALYEALVRAGARSPGAHRGLPLRHPERFLTGRQRSEHGRATALRMDCAAACP
ncbi:MAG TPA: alpha/beta hydrolase [Trebonia sp.]|nr:alpha/beta hydrolase [Trebonia sp.]